MKCVESQIHWDVSTSSAQFRVMMPDSGKSNKAYKLIKVMNTAENGPDHHAGCTPFPQSRIISNENYAKGVVTEILKAEILHTMLEQRP